MSSLKVKLDENRLVRAAGFLLAGGRSSRMGQDKSFLMLNGKPLAQIGLRKLHEVCTEVAIAGGTKDLMQFGRVIQDERPDCGPLGGIVSALEQTSCEWSLFLAVDTPFVPISVLKSLLFIASVSSSVCVMARVQGRMHPLCAVYSRSALNILQRELAAGRWKVTQVIEAAGPVEMVDFDEANWFANLNTPEDFAEAERHSSALNT